MRSLKAKEIRSQRSNSLYQSSGEVIVKERVVTIKNSAGIHCRPSSEILNVINSKYSAHSIVVSTEEETVEINGSILALISLGLACGTSAVLRIEGPEEEKAIKEIGDLFEHEFDFPPR